MRTLATEMVKHQVGTSRMVTELPVIPADAPPVLAEGLRRRRVAALQGRCPCGAVRIPFTAPGRKFRTPTTQQAQWTPFNHRADCPAHDEPLTAALTAWQQGKA